MDFISLVTNGTDFSFFIVLALCGVLFSAYTCVDYANYCIREMNVELVAKNISSLKLIKSNSKFTEEVLEQNKKLVHQLKLASGVIDFLEKKIGKSEEEIYG